MVTGGMTKEDPIKCPRCRSTQIQAGTRGWNIWTGIIGSHKVVLTCLKCGFRFNPGQRPKNTTLSDPNIAEIFIYVNHEKHGPYPVDHVKQWLDSGHVNGTVLAWHEGCPEWIPLSSIFKSD
jgi:hypothetical protein